MATAHHFTRSASAAWRALQSRYAFAIRSRSAASSLSLGSSGARTGSTHGCSRLASIDGLTAWKELPQAVRSSAHGRRLSAIARDRSGIDLLHLGDDLGFGVVELLGELGDRDGVLALIFLALLDHRIGGLELDIQRTVLGPCVLEQDAGRRQQGG